MVNYCFFLQALCDALIELSHAVVMAGVRFASLRAAFLPKAAFLALRLWQRLLETDNAGSLWSLVFGELVLFVQENTGGLGK